jgi:hypothetical protein
MIDLAKVSRKYWYDDLWKMQPVKKLLAAAPPLLTILP